MRHLLISVLMLAGCTKTPQEAVQTFTATVSDGFQARGGVAVGDRHAVADLSLIETSDSTIVRIGPEVGLNGRILNRTEPLGVAILYLDRAISAPTLGDSGALDVGSTLYAGKFEETGITEVAAAVTGIRFHQKRWYLETTLPLGEEQIGTGVFDDNGALVGLYGFELTPALRYVLPIEYVTAVPDGPAANVVDHDASSTFSAHAQEAAASEVDLVPPPTFESLEVQHNFAHRDLVGVITHQRKKNAAFDPATVTWKLAAVVSDDERTEVATGALSAQHAQWHTDEAAQAADRAEWVARFGEEMAAERLDPYQRGDLRFRIPASAYCAKVAAGSAYALTLDLGDGRKTEELTYGDLVNVCADLEAGEGTAWVESWGFSPSLPERKGKKRKARRRRRR